MQTTISLSPVEQRRLLRTLIKAGFTDERLRAMIGRNRLASAARFGLDGALGFYRVPVDYDLPIPRAIRRAKFESAWLDGSYTLDPKRSGRVIVDMELAELPSDLSLSETIRYLGERGRPTDLRELLALATARPELQFQHRIVGLGTLLRFPKGEVYAAVLSHADGWPWRRMWTEKLPDDDGKCNHRCRYAIVRSPGASGS